MGQVQPTGVDVSDTPLAPDRYPWSPTRHAGVLHAGRFEPTNDLDRNLVAGGGPPLDDRHEVIAVGSNASPAVMHRKLLHAATRPIAMTIGRHDGIAVGHSAHVSMPGYIAAAPYRCARCSRAFVSVHVDDDQLEALDATEPNYRRVAVGDAWIYASHWGVLALQGSPIGLRPQSDLHATLADGDQRFADAMSAVPAGHVTATLAHDGASDPWRHHWVAAGMARHDGFGSQPG